MTFTLLAGTRGRRGEDERWDGEDIFREGDDQCWSTEEVQEKGRGRKWEGKGRRDPKKRLNRKIWDCQRGERGGDSKKRGISEGMSGNKAG